MLPVDYGPADRPARRRRASRSSSRCGSSPTRTSGSASTTRSPAPEARYEQRESVELAFIAALQHLPARQRAVLILRDVLGFSGDEVAEALETTPAAVYSALQRAHKSVDARLPERSQQATLRSLGDDALREIVDAFVAAWERADVDAVVAMLAEDATIAMPPMPTWYRGRDAVAGFLRRSPLRRAAGGVSCRSGERPARLRLLPATTRRAPSSRTASTCSRWTARGSPSSRPSSSPKLRALRAAAELERVSARRPGPGLRTRARRGAAG